MLRWFGHGGTSGYRPTYSAADGLICLSCKGQVCPARTYIFATAWLSFIAFLPFVGAAFAAGLRGRWIPILLLLLGFLRVLSFATVPRWYDAGKHKHRVAFFWSMWIVIAVFLSVYYLVGAGVALDLGGTVAMNEHVSSLSMPLAFFDRRFIITPDTPIADVFGITFGDGLFFSSLVLLCLYSVRAVFRRGRPVTMNLSGPSHDEDD